MYLGVEIDRSKSTHHRSLELVVTKSILVSNNLITRGSVKTPSSSTDYQENQDPSFQHRLPRESRPLLPTQTTKRSKTPPSNTDYQEKQDPSFQHRLPREARPLSTQTTKRTKTPPSNTDYQENQDSFFQHRLPREPRLLSTQTPHQVNNESVFLPKVHTSAYYLVSTLHNIIVNVHVHLTYFTTC